MAHICKTQIGSSCLGKWPRMLSSETALIFLCSSKHLVTSLLVHLGLASCRLVAQERKNDSRHAEYGFHLFQFSVATHLSRVSSATYHHAVPRESFLGHSRAWTARRAPPDGADLDLQDKPSESPNVKDYSGGDHHASKNITTDARTHAQDVDTHVKEQKQANRSMHDQFNEARLDKGEAVYPSSGQPNSAQ